MQRRHIEKGILGIISAWQYLTPGYSRILTSDAELHFLRITLMAGGGLMMTMGMEPI